MYLTVVPVVRLVLVLAVALVSAGADTYNCIHWGCFQQSQVFYSTLYCGKSTQKEDAERQQRINHAINRRLLQIQNKVLNRTQSEDEVQNGFVEGLCWMLRALIAATTRSRISSTMQYLSILLVGQLEATLEGWHTDVCIHINIFKGEKIARQDSYSDDCVH